MTVLVRLGNTPTPHTENTKQIVLRVLWLPDATACRTEKVDIIKKNYSLKYHPLKQPQGHFRQCHADGCWFVSSHCSLKNTEAQCGAYSSEPQCGPCATSISTIRDLLKIQILQPYPIPPESETLAGSSILRFNKPNR